MATEVHIGGQGPMLLGVMWTLTIFTTLLVAARLFIRIRVLRNFGLDDWLIAVSMVMGIIYVITTTVSVLYGYGQHTSTLSKTDLTSALVWSYVSFVFGILSFALPKLAVASLLTRLFNPGHWHRIWLWLLASLVAVVAIINILILFTMCDPPKAMWMPELAAEGLAKCRSPEILIGYATFNGALSGFADLYLAVYPSFVLFKLQLTMRKKLALSATLGFGAISCAIAVVKCIQLKGLANLADPTTSTVPLVIWTNVEANMVVIASCIPTLQPLIELIMGKRKLSSFSRSNRYQRSTTQVNRTKQSNLSNVKILKTDVESQPSPMTPRYGGTFDGHIGDLPYSITRTDDVLVEYELHSPTSPTSPKEKNMFQ